MGYVITMPVYIACHRYGLSTLAVGIILSSRSLLFLIIYALQLLTSAATAFPDSYKVTAGKLASHTHTLPSLDFVWRIFSPPSAAGKAFQDLLISF